MFQNAFLSALIENDRKCDANTKTPPREHLQNDRRLQSGDELRGTVSKKKKKTSSKLNAADSFLHSFVSSMDFTRLFLSSGNRFYLVFRSTGDTDCLAWRRPAEGKKWKKKKEKKQPGSQMRRADWQTHREVYSTPVLEERSHIL